MKKKCLLCDVVVDADQDVDGDCEAFISGDKLALNGEVGGVK